MDRALYKSRAKSRLKGKWVISILVALVYVVASEGGGFIKFTDNVDIESVRQSMGNMMGSLREIGGRFIFPMGGWIANLIGGLFFPLALLLVLSGILVSIFLINPLIVGLTNYFRLLDLGEEPTVEDIKVPFQREHYMNVVKIMFRKGLVIFIGFLLLIVPGIYLSYKYRFVDWLLAEDPGYSSADIFDRTGGLTNGRKLDLFVLDLSFLGWAILVGLTAGIATPVLKAYELATEAAVFHGFSGISDNVTRGYENVAY